MEPGSGIFELLAASAVGTFVRENAWAYPLLETLHIFGIALVMGGIFLFDLRLLGVGTALPVTSLSTHIIRWVVIGIALNVVTGALLFLSDAAEFAANASFRVKLVLIGLALANALVFRAAVGRPAAAWERDAIPPRAVRVQAALSLLLWGGVVIAGRMMAYIK